MRRSAKTYWGPDPPSNPILESSPPLLGLEAVAWDYMALEKDYKEDANKAFNFLVHEDSGLGKRNNTSKRQFARIFGVYNVPLTTCHKCNIERE